VLLALPTFMPYDAIGNDVLGMADCFQNAGYQTTIFAQWIAPARASVSRRIDLESDATWSCPEDILIYHHALHWEVGEALLAKARTKVVVKHHNVTPPAFYQRYSEYLFRACQEGMEATRRIARHPRAWFWADSSFNAAELVRCGAPPERCRVAAPCHRIEEELASAPLDNTVLGRLRGGTNILFVGSLRPHKGHLKALEVLAHYRDLSDRRACLLLVGGSDPDLRLYEDDIRARAGQLGVERYVDITAGASPGQLRSFYLAGDVFLCLSEHEGFCVPLVESMYFRLPIVAWATTAVKETCAGAGMVFDEFKAGSLAECLDECVENPAWALEFADRGRRRYEEVFRPEAIRRRLLDLLAEVEEMG